MCKQEASEEQEDDDDDNAAIIWPTLQFPPPLKFDCIALQVDRVTNNNRIQSEISKKTAKTKLIFEADSNRSSLTIKKNLRAGTSAHFGLFPLLRRERGSAYELGHYTPTACSHFMTMSASFEF